MINIEEKYLETLISRLETLKAGVEELENDIKALAAAAPDIPVAELVEAPVAEPVEAPAVEEIPSQAGDDPLAIDDTIVMAGSDRPSPVAELVEAPVAEPVEAPTPVEEPEEQPIDIIPEDDTPIDIGISDAEIPGQAGDDPIVMAGSDRPSPVAEPFEAPRKSILDTAKADTAVMDVMAEKQAWRTDRPGMPVKNIISAISLNDRVLLINVLFDEDPMLFQETIARFNSMGSLSEALAYIAENHPGWDMNSEPVYRLMMAVRRKLS